jgi:hypothetical protein
MAVGISQRGTKTVKARNNILKRESSVLNRTQFGLVPGVHKFNQVGEELNWRMVEIRGEKENLSDCFALFCVAVLGL